MKLLEILKDQEKLKEIYHSQKPLLGYGEIKPSEFSVILNEFSPPWQRKIQNRKVGELKTKHEIGEFDGRAAVSAFALVMEKNCFIPGKNKNDIRPICINGQHGGKAVSETDKILDCCCHIFPCKTERDAQVLYSKIDGARRRDVTTQSKVLGFNNKYVLSANQQSKFLTAVTYMCIMMRHRGRLGYFANSTPLKEEFMDFYQEEMHLFLRILADYNANAKDLKDKLSDSPYLAVFLMILKDQSEKGEEFLRALLSPTTPGTIENFVKYLKSYQSNTKSNKWKKTDNYSVIGHKLAKAWNAFFESKTVSVNKVDNLLPLDVIGTRYTSYYTELFGIETPPDIDFVEEFKDYFLSDDWEYVE